MHLLRLHPATDTDPIQITLETVEASILVGVIADTEHANELATLFVQAPLGAQLVREALAILTNAEELDVRDWVRSARAFLETVSNPEHIR